MEDSRRCCGTRCALFHGLRRCCRWSGMPARCSPPTRREAPWLRRPEEEVREEDLPTQHPATGPPTRVPSPHVDQGRPPHSPRPPPARSGPAIGLIHRVRDRATFAALQRRGRRLVSGPVTVVYLEDTVKTLEIKGNSAVGPPRVGFAVPRAVGPAVVRNRVRRRLRGVLAERAARGQLPAGSWLFIVRPAAGAWTSEQFGEVVDAAVARRGTAGVGPAAGPDQVRSGDR